MRRHISQREAHQLKNRVQKLENILKDQRNAWTRGWPGGADLGSIVLPDRLAGSVEAARRLEHAVVVTLSGSQASFYGCKIGKP